MSRDEIYNAIIRERIRQYEKWGTAIRRMENSASSNEWKSAVLGEEYGEVAKAVVEGNLAEIKKELIHTAAVCFAWLESLN